MGFFKARTMIGIKIRFNAGKNKWTRVTSELSFQDMVETMWCCMNGKIILNCLKGKVRSDIFSKETHQIINTSDAQLTLFRTNKNRQFYFQKYSFWICDERQGKILIKHKFSNQLKTQFPRHNFSKQESQHHTVFPGTSKVYFCAVEKVLLLV